MNRLLSTPILGSFPAEPAPGSAASGPAAAADAQLWLAEPSRDVYGLEESESAAAARFALAPPADAAEAAVHISAATLSSRREALAELVRRLRVRPQDAVLVVREGLIPGLYDTACYDAATPDLAAKAFTAAGAAVTVLTMPLRPVDSSEMDRAAGDRVADDGDRVADDGDELMAELRAAVAAVDHTVFFSRLGVQLQQEEWLARSRRDGASTTFVQRCSEDEALAAGGGEIAYTARWDISGRGCSPTVF